MMVSPAFKARLGYSAAVFAVDVLLCALAHLTALRMPPGRARAAFLLPITAALFALPLLAVNGSEDPLLAQTLCCLMSMSAFKVISLSAGRGCLAAPEQRDVGRFLLIAILPVIPAPGAAIVTGWRKRWAVTFLRLRWATANLASFVLLATLATTGIRKSENLLQEIRAARAATTTAGVSADAAAAPVTTPGIGAVVLALNLTRLLSYFFVGVALMVEVTGAGDLMDAVALLLGGIPAEPHFDRVWLATSFSELWGRRWNLTVTSVLRPTCYDPVLEGRWLAGTSSPSSPKPDKEEACGGDKPGAAAVRHSKSTLPGYEIFSSLSPHASNHSSYSCNGGTSSSISCGSSIASGIGGVATASGYNFNGSSCGGGDGDGIIATDDGSITTYVGGSKGYLRRAVHHRNDRTATSGGGGGGALELQKSGMLVPSEQQKQQPALPPLPPPPQQHHHHHQQQKQKKQQQQQHYRRRRDTLGWRPPLQQQQQQHLDQAPNSRKPSRLRRFAATQLTFLVSGLWHELVCYSMCGTTSGGRWLLLFTMQAPLLLVETELRWRSRRMRLRVPNLAARLAVQLLFFGQLMLLWYPPMRRTGLLDNLIRTGDEVTAAATTLLATLKHNGVAELLMATGSAKQLWPNPAKAFL